jgi:hypothetical protein
MIFSVTYEIITEESACDGDAEERGFIEEGVGLRDAIAAVRDTRTCHVGGVECVEPSDSNVANARWITVCNSMEYLTGAQESRSIHFPDSLTSATRVRIARLLGVRV